MRLLAAIAALGFALLAAEGARAERLTIAVSAPEVKIDSSFTGINITVFGVIADQALSSADGRSYHVAVLILGPAETAVVRRKDRVAGVWMNGAAETVLRPASFYDLSSSGPIDELAEPAVLGQLGLGFEHIPFVFDGRGEVNDPDAAEFRKAFIRLKQKQGLFNQQLGVNFVAPQIFRTDMRLPANIPVGRYAVIAYLFDGKNLLANAQQTIEVSTTGIEATLAGFARGQSLVYGILCAGLALFVGWLGGVIFRRD